MISFSRKKFKKTKPYSDSSADISNRFQWATKLVGLLAITLIVRAAWVQLIGDSRIAGLSRKQSYGKLVVQPKRGEIKDRNGVALAVNSEAYSLGVDATRLENPHQFAFLIQKALGIPASKLRQKLREKIKEKKSFYWVKRDLTQNELNQLKRYRVITLRSTGFSGALIPGALFIRENKRIYPQGDLAGQVIGSINIDGEGIEGLELHQNERLRGQSLFVSAVKDALGRPSALNLSEVKRADSLQENADGREVVTTIDAAVQFATENILKSAVSKYQARSGVALVMDAGTGEIISLAQVPLRNPNEKNVSQALRRNRAITDGYEPGSTLKPVIVAGALQSGMKISDVLWGERGDFKVQGVRIPEAESHEKFEWLTLAQILQFSSNIGAAKLALKLGTKKVSSTLENFGFGQKTQIELPGEISGRLGLSTKKGAESEISWRPLRLANVGFGQGILVSPIQIAKAYATFFNGGFLIRPRLIRPEGLNEKIEGTSTQNNAPKNDKKRILSESDAQHIRRALTEAVSIEGTGKNAQIPGYDIAGKTGTSQLVDEKTGRYSKSNYVSSFVGSILGVQPGFVILVAIYEPRGAFYGGEVAAPIFKEIGEYLIQRYHWAPNSQWLANQIVEQKKTENQVSVELTSDKIRNGRFEGPIASKSISSEYFGKIPEKNTAHSAEDKRSEEKRKLPSLIGLRPKQAMKILSELEANLEIRAFEKPGKNTAKKKFTGTNRRVIVSQSPEAGTEIISNSQKDPIVIRIKLNDQ